MVHSQHRYKLVYIEDIEDHRVAVLHQPIWSAMLMKVELMAKHLSLELEDYTELTHLLSVHCFPQLIV